ncbi:heavy-metal-associated domain-containing protein [Azonexus sp.]|uniref:heavy-metal-associated domain-containing protein n=1 Tax=Azonexus sp. TaxID=1872668 RepID=UPI0027B9293A|nr:heavy metal-associated domain-containing protein [Azonexus sp.]
MHRQSFKVAGLRDAHCVRTLANAIQDLPSVSHLDIEPESGLTDVEHGNFVSPEDILQAITDAGFSAEYTTH